MTSQKKDSSRKYFTYIFHTRTQVWHICLIFHVQGTWSGGTRGQYLTSSTPRTWWLTTSSLCSRTSTRWRQAILWCQSTMASLVSLHLPSPPPGSLSTQPGTQPSPTWSKEWKTFKVVFPATLPMSPCVTLTQVTECCHPRPSYGGQLWLVYLTSLHGEPGQVGPWVLGWPWECCPGWHRSRPGLSPGQPSLQSTRKVGRVKTTLDN